MPSLKCSGLLLFFRQRNPAKGLDPGSEYSHCVTWSWKRNWLDPDSRSLLLTARLSP